MATFLVSLLFILPLLAFYVWMFRDLTTNDTLTYEARSTWLWAFILLNVFAAAVYYVNEYRPRH